MSGAIRFLNIDLDLLSAADLTPLTTGLQSAGLVVLHCDQDGSGQWRAVLEAGAVKSTPDQRAAELLYALERLSLPLRAVWDGCTTRQFNIGYECNNASVAFMEGISPDVLRRMANLQIGLKMTLYRQDKPE